jgi:hypothetical protein
VTSALDGGGWSAPRPGRFTTGIDPVPIVRVHEAGLYLGVGGNRGQKGGVNILARNKTSISFKN